MLGPGQWPQSSACPQGHWPAVSRQLGVRCPSQTLNAGASTSVLDANSWIFFPRVWGDWTTPSYPLFTGHGVIWGSSEGERLWGSCEQDKVCRSAEQARLWGREGWLRQPGFQGALSERVWESEGALVQRLWGSAEKGRLWGSSDPERLWESREQDRVWGASLGERLWGSKSAGALREGESGGARL